MKECKIYVLKDPRSKEVRYVGRTTMLLDQRLRSHTLEAIHNTRLPDKAKFVWIKYLLSLGYNPLIEEVASVSIVKASEEEFYWIDYYKKMGCILFNTHGFKNNKTNKICEMPIQEPVQKLIYPKARKNASGRKPIAPEDRKTTVQCYPKQAIVDAIGYEKCQEITLQALEKEYAKIILEKD